MINIFDQQQANALAARVNSLTSETQRKWGKMDVAQMLKHCSVTFEYALKDGLPRPNAVMRFMVNLFFKSMIVGDRPYKKNLATAPNMRIKEARDIEKEKAKLAGYIAEVSGKGAAAFENKKHPVFGVLTAQQWSTLLSKHLDHHLQQFGA